MFMKSNGPTKSQESDYISSNKSGLSRILSAEILDQITIKQNEFGKKGFFVFLNKWNNWFFILGNTKFMVFSKNFQDPLARTLCTLLIEASYTISSVLYCK